MSDKALIDELYLAVARVARLGPEQAVLATQAMLRFFTVHLPSPLVGELQSRLRGPATQERPQAPAGPDE